MTADTVATPTIDSPRGTGTSAPSIAVRPGWSARTAGLTAGVGLVLMAALAGVGVFVAVDGLVTPGDATRTVADIRDAEGLFRLGIASLIGVVALDVVVAWALHRVFRPVHAGGSLLAAVLRLVYSGVFLVAIAQLLEVPRLLESGAHVAALGPDLHAAEVMLRIDAFHDIWGAGLVLFGLHLVVVGYLAHRAVVMPRWLGVLVVVAGVGYVVDSLAAVLAIEVPEVAGITFVGEVLLAIWLLARSRRLQVLDAATA